MSATISALTDGRPIRGDQAAAPAQDGAGGDEPVHPQLCWKEPHECGEDSDVSLLSAAFVLAVLVGQGIEDAHDVGVVGRVGEAR